MAKKKMLVAGASGLVGFAAVKHFAQCPDWEVVGVSRRIPPDLEGATLLSVDLMDKARCTEVFGQLRDVTEDCAQFVLWKSGDVQGIHLGSPSPWPSPSREREFLHEHTADTELRANFM